MQFFLLFLTALFVTMVSVPMLMRMAQRLHFVDLPEPRKVHETPIPRVGGIGMVLGTLSATLLWLPPDATLRALYLGILVLSVFGILDDRLDLDYRLKFLGQFSAVLVVVGLGGLLVRHLDLGTPEDLPAWAAWTLTLLFLVGSTNAMNLSDGLDGLAAGLGALSLAAIIFLADLADGAAVVAVSLATLGAIFGFLRYNTHPAVVFMGDTGSQFLGFTTGTLAVLTTQKINTAVAGTLPLLILGLPVVDTLRVMGERLAHGVSPFRPDRRHFHHKLLSLGFDHYESVLIGYAIQALFVLLAVRLRYESDSLILGVWASLFAAIGLSYPLAMALRWRLRNLGKREASPLSRAVAVLLSQRWFQEAGFTLTLALTATLLLGGALLTRTVDPETGWSAALVLAFWGLVLPFRRWRPLGRRLGIYAAIIAVIYLIGTGGSVQAELVRAALVLTILLAGSVGLGMRFSRRDLGITPSDFLVLFILVAASALPLFANLNYALLAAEAAVLLYGVEYLLRRSPPRSPALLDGSAVLALALILVRGVGSP